MSGSTPPPPAAEELLDLAMRVLALVPSRVDPERFWIRKGEIAAALRAMARRAEERERAP